MNDLRYQCSSIPAFADCFIKTKVFKNGNIEASVLLIMGGLGPVGAIGGPEQQYALKWNDFHASILSSFRHLRDQEDFIDVTIACDGCSFTAHKVVLSACSPYFRSLLKANPCQHPIVILRDVRVQDMEALLRFMYNGEVHIGQEQLADFLKTAQTLQVRGLAEVSNKDPKLSNSHSVPWHGSRHGSSASSDGHPPSKRSRHSDRKNSRYSESPMSHGNVSNEEHLDGKSLSDNLLSHSHGGEGSQSTSNSNQLKPASLPSSQIHSSNEDSNSYDEGSDADGTDRPSSVSDFVQPKLETPDYGLDRSRGDYDGSRHRGSYGGGLFNLPGLTGGLIPGPSGGHNNSQDGFGLLRRGSDAGKVRATDPRPCPQCGKIYRSAHTLRTHLEDKHTVCPGYRCVLCGTVAKSRNSLHSHMSRQHRGISTKDLPVLPMPSPFDPELASKLYHKAGVKMSPAELKARASPTGTMSLRRSDVSENNGSGADDDPQDLSLNSSSNHRYSSRDLPPHPSSTTMNMPLDFHLNSMQNYPKINSSMVPALPPDKDGRGLSVTPVGATMLDAYLRLLADNNYVTQEQATEMSASAKLAAAQKEWSNHHYNFAKEENESSSSHDEESLSEDEPEPIKADQ